MGCCRFTSGIAKGCGGSIGGIKAVYVTCWQPEMATLDSTTLNVTDWITSVTCWNKIDFFKQTSSMTVNAIYVEGQGVSGYETVVSLVLGQLTPARNQLVDNILKSTDVAVVVEDNNGNKWFISNDYPSNATAGTAVTGTAFTDANGYTMEITGHSLMMPLGVNPVMNVCS